VAEGKEALICRLGFALGRDVSKGGTKRVEGARGVEKNPLSFPTNQEGGGSGFSELL